jgi:proteic killer suppression protein
MIKTFKHKGLKALYETGSQKGVRPDHAKRLRLILARLDASQSEEDMNLPGLRLHPLKGDKKGFWAVDVSGGWRVFFRFEGNHALDVDYDNYH